MTVQTVIEAVRDGMQEEMRRDQSVFIMGEDIGARGGVFLATEGFVGEFGEDRVIDTPLAESSIAGIALGAAMNGMRPIAEIEFADFIWPTVNQIVGEAARARYGTLGQMSVPMVLRAPQGGGVRGGLYHSQSVEAIFAHTPGLKVVTPSTPYDAKGLLTTAIRDPDPVVFVEHVEMYQNVGPVPRGNYVVPFGQASVPRVGSDVTIVAWMNMVPMALEAANKLENEDVSVEVVDLRTLVPLDKETVIQSVIKTGRLVIAHEAVRRGGFGAEIAAIVSNSKAFRHLKAPITRVANIGAPIPHSKHLQRMVLPNECDIIEEVRRVIAYK